MEIKTTERRAQVTASARKGDPIVCALNTVMYGGLIHWFSMTAILAKLPSTCNGDGPRTAEALNGQGTLLLLLLLHEYWIFLQHSNVLGNIHCQRLDRQYGVALLRSNQHWAVAGTLSAYWCRETLGMCLCLPFLISTKRNQIFSTDKTTAYLVMYSLIYHAIKSRGIRRDALRRFSPAPFGIMRLVIDNFYWHSLDETLLSLLRFYLQGFDTFIHYRIVQALMVYSASSTGDSHSKVLNTLFAVWVVHAAMNQYFCMSTATVMVHAWRSMTRTKMSEAESDQEEETEPKSDDSLSGTEHFEGKEEASMLLKSDRSVVRQLLQKARVSRRLWGRQGVTTRGVDKVIRLETGVVVMSLVFLAVGDVPFRIFVEDWTEISKLLRFKQDHDWTQYMHDCPNVFLFVWLVSSILHGMWVMFLRAPSSFQSVSPQQDRLYAIRRVTFIQVIDLAVLFTGHNANDTIPALVKVVTVLIVSRSFLQAHRSKAVALLRKLLLVLELIGKANIARQIVILGEGSMAISLAGSAMNALWILWTVYSAYPNRCELESRGSNYLNPADIVFLGHPAELGDCWALWLLPYNLEERWECPWWAIPLWPLHYLVGLFVCNYRRRLFGDSGSFFCCDSVQYRDHKMQTWTAAHFGRHFVTHPRQVQRNIEAAARHAETNGIKVLCLGALNKAESINGGGAGVARLLGRTRRLSLIHGNHLTAAAVVETTYKYLGKKAKVFLTGASSKVGWAVAQTLRSRYGYEILCHSTDRERRKHFEQNGFRAADSLFDGIEYSNVWIVGKYDRIVAELIPQNATAIVFSVPHPLSSRKDLRVVEAGTLHMDLSNLDRPRQFTNKLREHEIFACHAASVVAAERLKRTGKRVDEIGSVDPNEMESWLEDAKKLGFCVPRMISEDRKSRINHTPVIVIGAGPSGLAVAASLRRLSIQVILLESQSDTTLFGSWKHHFSDLEVTTQRKLCDLPHFPMPDSLFPGDNVSADEYGRYLRLYAARFGLEILRGTVVSSICKGDETKPWLAKESNGKVHVGSAVVIATGKHRVPKRNTSNNISAKLVAAGISFVHSTDLCDEATWNKVMKAAALGRLCMVGFGNSAADLCTSILSKNKDAKIHVSVRTVPPIFPRKRGPLRIDTLGLLLRVLPSFVQEIVIRLLWWAIPSSRKSDSAFPTNLPRWKKVHGRVPVVDKYGAIATGLDSGNIVAHGQVKDAVRGDGEGGINFVGEPETSIPIDLVVLATGYESQILLEREDRLNGLYTVGFGKDLFLPLRSIGEEADRVAKAIAAGFSET